MSNDILDSLVAEVAEVKSVNASVITLLAGLKAKLDEGIVSDDTEVLKNLSASLGESTKALSEAITANTPPPSPPVVNPLTEEPSV